MERETRSRKYWRTLFTDFIFYFICLPEDALSGLEIWYSRGCGWCIYLFFPFNLSASGRSLSRVVIYSDREVGGLRVIVEVRRVYLVGLWSRKGDVRRGFASNLDALTAYSGSSDDLLNCERFDCFGAGTRWSVVFFPMRLRMLYSPFL